MLRRDAACVLVVLALTSAVDLIGGPAQNCEILTDQSRARISAYVSDRYEFAPDVTIEDLGLIEGTCFRRIVIQPSEPRQMLTLFLSPDQRFLSESLLDTSVVPGEERRRVAKVTERDLLADRSPSYGPSDAQVTVVEFSDFECQFCKRLANFLDRFPTDGRPKIRLIFKHLPLSMHPWARRAALTSICASLQSDGAFWNLQRFFFSNQETITLDNLDLKTAALAAEGGINLAQAQACLRNGTAEAVLARDEELANRYHVSATPTVFINGIRRVGFTPDQLQAALRRAAIESKAENTSDAQR